MGIEFAAKGAVNEFDYMPTRGVLHRERDMRSEGCVGNGSCFGDEGEQSFMDVVFDAWGVLKQFQVPPQPSQLEGDVNSTFPEGSLRDSSFNCHNRELPCVEIGFIEKPAINQHNVTLYGSWLQREDVKFSGGASGDPQCFDHNPKPISGGSQPSHRHAGSKCRRTLGVIVENFPCNQEPDAILESLSTILNKPSYQLMLLSGGSRAMVATKDEKEAQAVLALHGMPMQHNGMVSVLRTHKVFDNVTVLSDPQVEVNGMSVLESLLTGTVSDLPVAPLQELPAAAADQHVDARCLLDTLLHPEVASKLADTKDALVSAMRSELPEAPVPVQQLGHVPRPADDERQREPHNIGSERNLTIFGLPPGLCEHNHHETLSLRQCPRLAIALAAVLEQAKERELVTYAITNIPREHGRNAVLTVLNATGYRGKFDFLYVPKDFHRFEWNGYAFVNFRNSKAGADFAERWNLKQWPGMQHVIEVKPAKVQGLKANLLQFYKRRVRKHIREQAGMPIVFMSEEDHTGTVLLPDYLPPDLRRRLGITDAFLQS